MEHAKKSSSQKKIILFLCIYFLHTSYTAGLQITLFEYIFDKMLYHLYIYIYIYLRICSLSLLHYVQPPKQ